MFRSQPGSRNKSQAGTPIGEDSCGSYQPAMPFRQAGVGGFQRPTPSCVGQTHAQRNLCYLSASSRSDQRSRNSQDSGKSSGAGVGTSHPGKVATAQRPSKEGKGLVRPAQTKGSCRVGSPEISRRKTIGDGWIHHLLRCPNPSGKEGRTLGRVPLEDSQGGAQRQSHQDSGNRRHKSLCLDVLSCQIQLKIRWRPNARGAAVV